MKAIKAVDREVELEFAGKVQPEQVRLLHSERHDTEVHHLDPTRGGLEQPLQLGREVLSGRGLGTKMKDPPKTPIRKTPEGFAGSKRV